MAGNKINTKTKGKEEKNKTSKNQSNEENEDMDFSLLRKPILTSVTGFSQAITIFDLATEELKGLLSNDCDLLYECKVCRNIFRSLANFISHKRVYCTERFNSSLHGPFFKAASTLQEAMKIKKLEESYFEVMKNKTGIEAIDPDEVDNRIPLTKDLTAIIDKMVKNKGENASMSEEQNVTLQKIPNSSVAVFQSLNNNEEKQDKMRAQVKELDTILSKDKAILQMDGKFSIMSSLPPEADSVIQISDDEDEAGDNLKCKICDQNFSTQKTLKFHMKYKHLESRLVYPCPDCLEIFSTSWSVYRHLFKVHRKSAAQIRRLRESIQAKSFRMNNPPAFYERRKNMKQQTPKISEEERLDQENQAWMDNVEGDGDMPRCFGCGRTFERRAALVAHTHTCQPRSRALARRLPETKKIEIQIRKDYNKGPTTASLNLPAKSDSSETKTAEEATVAVKEKETQDKDNDKQLLNEILEEGTMDVIDEDEKSNGTDSPEKSQDVVPKVLHKPTIKLPFAQQAEKSNLTAFRQKIQPDIEVNTLLCKKCDIQHNTVQELYDHMASHYKWMRYACKLCNFKTYTFEKLPDHVKVVHKLKGDSEFYFSTVKAIDGNEALELSESVEEPPDSNDVSPDTRRQSRCSSDSSRLSDDSSSSSTRVEAGSRKRKMCHIKNSGKRKKESFVNDDDDDSKADMSLDKDSISMDNDTSSVSKTFEENSSDMDDLDDKITKRQTIELTSSVASRRPVRKKTKIKNDDYEYDLSNLLKREAQGYRDAQTSVNTKSNHTKKKSNQQDSQNYYEIINRDCCGALATLSKKAVENSTAHIKSITFLNINQKESRPSNVFVRPMLPKSISRGEKSSPKKDSVEEAKDIASPQKEVPTNVNVAEETVKNSAENEVKTSEEVKENPSKEEDCNKPIVRDALKTNLNIPAVLPIKFRRQSLEFIKNPIINKNITDFKKAGMKTKILVIKPIHRSKDGLPATNTPLKFQTIKLKDPTKSSSSNEEKTSDQVVVVKVPKVEAITRTVADTNVLNTEVTKCVVNNINSVNNNISENNVNKTPVESNSVKGEEILNSDTSVNVPNSEESKPVSADNELKTDTESTENIPGET